MSGIFGLWLLKFGRVLQGRSLFLYQFLHYFSNSFVTDCYWKEKYYVSWLFGLTVWFSRCFSALKTEIVGWGAVSTIPSLCGHIKEKCFPYSSGVACKAVTSVGV